MNNRSILLCNRNPHIDFGVLVDLPLIVCNNHFVRSGEGFAFTQLSVPHFREVVNPQNHIL